MIRRPLRCLPLLLLTACGEGEGTETDGGPLEPDAAIAPDAAVVHTCPAAPAENEPNDTRQQATPLALGATPPLSCVAAPSDRDLQILTAPADPGGGYIELAVTDVGDGVPALKVISTVDEGGIGDYLGGRPGESILAHLAAAPGQRYRLEVSDFTLFRAPYLYRLAARYTKVDDFFEPNDTRGQARAITLGAPVRAFLFAGFVSADAPRVEAYDDWFSLTLRGETTTVKLEEVPGNIAPDLALYDAAGTQLARQFSATPGSSVTITHRADAGLHHVKVGVFAPRPTGEGSGPVLPAHFTRSYKLTVTQP